MSAQQFETAHIACQECDAAAEAARAYLADGGTLAGGKWRSSVRDENGPHWAAPVTTPTVKEPAAAEGPRGHEEELPGDADRQEVETLLEVISSAVGHAAAVIRFVDEVEGYSLGRPLGKHDRAAIGLVVSAADALAQRAGITSEDLPGGSASLRVQHPRSSGDQDSDVPALGERDRDPATAFTEGREGVVLDSPNVGAGNHESLAIDHELVVGHDASPSAGESAVPGQAGTASVEGEPAAGDPVAESPAATHRDGSGPTSSSGVSTVLSASAELLREITTLLDTEQVRGLVARSRAHLDAATSIDPGWPQSPTSKDLAEALHGIEAVLSLIDFRRREQESAALADAEVPTTRGDSLTDLQDAFDDGAEKVPGRAGRSAAGEGEDNSRELLEELAPALLREGFSVQDRDAEGGVRLVADVGEVYVPAFERLFEAGKELVQVLEPLVIRDGQRIEDLQAFVNGLLKGIDLRRGEVQRARR